MNFKIRNSKGFNRYKWHIFTVILLLTTFMCSSPEKTQPTAEQIMEDSIKATGGRAAYEKIRTRVSKGTMEIAGSGIKMSMTSYQAFPDKFYSVVESDVTGKIESGFNGEVVWENSALNGPSW